jgi:hypothetical protein
LAVLVMAFGNVGFAQNEANLKSNATQNVLKHYGVRDEIITVVPQTCFITGVNGDLARSTYTYDEYDYYLLEEMYSMSVGGQWLDMIRVSYEYDFSGNVMEKLTQLDATGMGNWTNREFVSYSYAGDELSEVIYQTWEGNEWVNKTKEVYNYNGDVTTVLYWAWNGNNWTSDELYTYTHSDGTIELLIQYMQGGAWQNDQKDTYSLDFDGNVVEILVEDWVGTSWEKYRKTTYNYEDQVFTSKLIEGWNGSSWESVYLSNYVYENGNAIQGICEMMSGGEWVPADGLIEIAYDYNAASITFTCHKVEAIYIDLTGVEENAQAANFKIYPVPAEGEITIEAENFQKAEIYSLTGQKLMESLQDNLNVGELSSGLYIIKVYDLEGNCDTQRFVVK